MIKNKNIFIILMVLCLCITIMFSIIIVKATTYKESLIGQTIYVDAGHGGKDNGASFEGVLEDEINLKIAGYVIENLMDLGAYVLTSRTSDYDLSNIYDKNKKKNDLINRVRQINDSKVDIFVSIHLNSYSSSNVSGAQVFYQKTDSSKLLAQTLQENLNTLNTSKDRKIKFGDYYILNKSHITGVIVECGFLSNAADRTNLTKPSYQQKVAGKITKGIIQYFNKRVD